MKLKMNFLFSYFLIFTFLSPALGFSQKTIESYDLKRWSKGCSPQEIGKRVADHLAARPLPLARSAWLVE